MWRRHVLLNGCAQMWRHGVLVLFIVLAAKCTSPLTNIILTLCLRIELRDPNDDMAVDLLKKDINHLIRSIPGLLAVLIIDRDGVPLIEVHRDLVPELALQASGLSMTVLAADQVTKLGFGKCNTICCTYENYQVVTFNKLPSSLVVTLIADSSANTGMLLSLGTDFDPVINELRKIKI